MPSISNLKLFNIRNAKFIINKGYIFNPLCVEGILTADKDYDLLIIDIPVYDEEECLIGTFQDSIRGIRKGDNWKFRAINCNIEDERVKSFNINKALLSGH